LVGVFGVVGSQEFIRISMGTASGCTGYVRRLPSTDTSCGWIPVWRPGWIPRLGRVHGFRGNHLVNKPLC